MQGVPNVQPFYVNPVHRLLDDQLIRGLQVQRRLLSAVRDLRSMPFVLVGFLHIFRWMHTVLTGGVVRKVSRVRLWLL